MKTIQIYDPPMCCSTGVCGPDIDPVLPRIAGWLHQLQEQGTVVERYNLAQQPLAFIQNPEVKHLLDTIGTDALPAVFIDGVLRLQGRYPETAECVSWSEDPSS
jgi:arsenite methyltransferase